MGIGNSKRSLQKTARTSSLC